MSARIVLITGANSGVGLATTKILTSTSTTYHVILSARTLPKAAAAKAEIEAENPTSASRLTPLELDVTSVASVTRARDTIEAQFGRLDALINNAAVANRGPDVYMRSRETMDVNVIGLAVVTDLFRPLLLKSANPYSIFVSSGAGSFGRTIERSKRTGEKPAEPPNGGAYHVSKAALNMLALREHVEFSEVGLKVFAMSPGFVVSGLRGKSEELRSGWGRAEPASEAGVFMLRILEGERDGDIGKLIWKGEVYEW